MISRLTDTPEENARPTVDTERLVDLCVDDPRTLSDVPPMGYAGGEYYPVDGLLVLTYRKFGNTYADPDDEDNATEYADTGLGFLTVDRVVELTLAAVNERTAGVMKPWDKDRAREWVLKQIERS